jgi:hypothetical protein
MGRADSSTRLPGGTANGGADLDQSANTFTINVNAVGATALNDTIYVSDSTNVVIPWSALLANDTGTNLTITSATLLLGAGAGGIPVTVDLVTKTVTFTTLGLRADDITGNTFTYIIQDANGHLSTATVTANVLDVNNST